MAPEIATQELRNLPPRSVVLDPMAGSGTVLRQASELGHTAIGFDLDPLAVMMARVWTTPGDSTSLMEVGKRIVEHARDLRMNDIYLPWIDDDEETSDFARFWFARSQRSDLRRIAFVLASFGTSTSRSAKASVADVFRIALSRIIVTKEKGASLARDVSHSRPHKVTESSDFEVFAAYERSVRQICHLLQTAPPRGNTTVGLNDARKLKSLGTCSVDAVLTSPPYLNAIDYMRGHRLSLVWLGYCLKDLRNVRSTSIGAERASDRKRNLSVVTEIQTSMCEVTKLPRRHQLMIRRYAEDVYAMTKQVARVLRPHGKAVFVVGNSCLSGTFVRNSEAVRRAAAEAGLRLARSAERELPIRRRYLPIPHTSDTSLGKRMRTETVLTFRHA
jgi:hypothetical protein